MDRGKVERPTGYSECVPTWEPGTFRVSIRDAAVLALTLDPSPSCSLFTFIGSYSNSPLTAAGQYKCCSVEECNSSMTA